MVSNKNLKLKMTIRTKTTLLGKPQVTKIPVVLDNVEDGEENEFSGSAQEQYKPVIGAVFCTFMIALMVMSAGILGGLEIYRGWAISRRPLRFCVTIPTKYVQDPEFGKPVKPYYSKNLLWVHKGEDDNTFGTIELDTRGFPQILREEIEFINKVEKVKVLNGPNEQPTSFVHDFANNVTGIVDDARCYVMDLDQSVVTSPDSMLLEIVSQERWEVTHVRRDLRALMPPLLDLAITSTELAAMCHGKPIYRLELAPVQLPEWNIAIRKREVVIPNFTEFAGRQVVDFKILNLAQLIDFENKEKTKNK